MLHNGLNATCETLMVAHSFNARFTLVGCGFGAQPHFRLKECMHVREGRQGMNLPVLVFSCPSGCTLHFGFIPAAALVHAFDSKDGTLQGFTHKSEEYV